MSDIKVKISKEPDIKVYIDGTRGDTAPGVYAPLEHNHEISQVNGLQEVLNDKSDIGHNHAISDITNLQNTLNSKSDTNHTHDYSAVYSPLNHNHNGVYSLINHTHDYSSIYAPIVHNHNGTYSLINHTHDYSGVYAPLYHSHVPADITGLFDLLDAKANDSRFNFYYAKYEIDGIVQTITQDTDDKLVNKQNNLVSGFNIKTIGGQSILGSGDIAIQSESQVEDQIVNGVVDKAPSQNAVYDALANKANFSHNHADIYYDKYEINGLLNNYAPYTYVDASTQQTLDFISQVQNDIYANTQEILVSGNNIKTIGGQSILGSGDLIISSGGVSKLSELEDTFIDSEFLTDGQLLQYDEYEQKWINVEPNFANVRHNHNLSSLNETNIYNPQTGQVLIFDGENWINSDLNNESNNIEDQIVNGVTDKAPSQNVVYDALANKSDLNHNHDDRYYTESEIDTKLGTKQDTLVSGTNIKTIGGQSILGSGNIVIEGGGSSTPAVQDVFTATAGQTVFNLSQAVNGVAIVTLNGVQVNPSDYSIAGSTLTFNYGLEVGDKVVVTYGISLAGTSTGGTTTTSYRGQVHKMIDYWRPQLVQDNSSGLWVTTLGREDFWSNSNVTSVNRASNTAGYNGQNYGKYGAIPKATMVTYTNSSQASLFRSIDTINFSIHKKTYIHYMFGHSTSSAGLEKSSSNTAMFSGLTQELYNIGNSTFTSMPVCFGVGWRLGSSNLEIVYKEYNGVPNVITLGGDFPVPNEKNGVFSYYDVTIEGTDIINRVKITVERKDIYKKYSQEFTLNLNYYNVPDSNFGKFTIFLKDYVLDGSQQGIALGQVELYDFVE